MTSNLTLDAAGGIVKVLWSGESKDKTWSSLRDFWKPFALDFEKENELVIPVGEFFSKRSWFQIYWIDQGRPIDIGDGLAPALEEAESQLRVFDTLAKTGYSKADDIKLSVAQIGIKRELTDSQLENIASMLKAPNGANFSVPGAGKTATQLALFSLLRNKGQLDRMLVICPKSSFEAWQDEPSQMFDDPEVVTIFESGFIDPTVKILVVNFEKLESATRRKQLLAWVAQVGGTSVVIDEAHRVKSGARGVRWRACVELSSFAKRVDLLSGTPMPQSFEDLRNLFSLSWRTVPRSQLNDDKLSTLTAGGLFVRTTKGQLGLPNINIHRVTLDMGKYQQQIYAALTKRYAGVLGIGTQDQLTLAKKGRAVMTLIAAATNPGLVAEKTRDELLVSLGWPPEDLSGTDFMEVLRNYLRHEIPPKFEWVIRYVSQAHKAGKKTLIWSSFVGNIELLRKYLAEFEPAVIHGSVSSGDRKAELERFRFDPHCSVLITNPQTLGEGVSLHQTAHEAVFVDRTYNAAQYLQALDRIHRLGLSPNQETNVFLLETQGTIDERVGARLATKITTLSDMLNDDGLVRVSLPGADEDQDLTELLGLDQEDLDDLLKHLKVV
jgi:SNF2 family DNA or RNA helicase